MVKRKNCFKHDNILYCCLCAKLIYSNTGHGIQQLLSLTLNYQSCHTVSLLLAMKLSTLLDSANTRAVLFHMTCHNGIVVLTDYSVNHHTKCTNSDYRESSRHINQRTLLACLHHEKKGRTPVLTEISSSSLSYSPNFIGFIHSILLKTIHALYMCEC